jgi:hypothetical protein
MSGKKATTVILDPEADRLLTRAVRERGGESELFGDRR